MSETRDQIPPAYLYLNLFNHNLCLSLQDKDHGCLGFLQFLFRRKVI